MGKIGCLLLGIRVIKANAYLHERSIFGKVFNSNTYENVIDACALRSDLKILPGGDQTEIGEKGTLK